MSIPHTRLLSFSAPITLAEHEREGARLRPSELTRGAERLRDRALELANHAETALISTSCAVQVTGSTQARVLTFDFCFTHLGEARWQSRTLVFDHGTEVATVEEEGTYGTEGGRLPQTLRWAAIDWAVDEAASAFQHVVEVIG